MVTIFTYRLSLVKIVVSNFELSWWQTHKQTHTQNRLQYTAPLSLARSVKIFHGDQGECRGARDQKRASLLWHSGGALSTSKYGRRSLSGDKILTLYQRTTGQRYGTAFKSGGAWENRCRCATGLRNAWHRNEFDNESETMQLDVIYNYTLHSRQTQADCRAEQQQVAISLR